MAIIVIKKKPNEAFSRPNEQYSIGDIIDILPRKKDKYGNPISDDRSPGYAVEKNFICIKVDLSFLTDKQFNDLRAGIRATETEEKTISEELHIDIKRKRVHRFDISNLKNLGDLSLEKDYTTIKSYIYNKINNKNLIEFALQDDPVSAAKQDIGEI